MKEYIGYEYHENNHREGQENFMKLRIIQLEDSVMKHSAISRVIKNVVPAEIDWVTDMYSGIKKIDEAYRSGIPYDLAITDMHYPLSPGGEADWEVGDIFVDIIGTKYLNPPIVICSTHNRKNPYAYDCVWYNDNYDWERRISDIVKCMYEEKRKAYEE